ncbi:hypothetical protein AOL_s00006g570 [Orbilia oligospora ATCC 24927]|uniref:Hydrophobin n=2 Tax=Orbilia oligospora TaxID=2813651 RepID=G1X119_ARTOA|nr:hypothetical protein AOL_s00006g570 [Orbilia oligospora ATCC 24927]EGX53192.1 hypothetical protein AOL_s00006g570 [Orbilia oligospora ATCC 24927]KAF3291556.1 hypothetical protein TWF970_000770 [Orbilia oligospora]
MQFSTLFTVVALALSVSALPNTAAGGKEVVFPIGNSVTMVEANKACGSNMKLNCCNDVDITKNAQSSAAGLLGLNLDRVLGKVGILGKCNEISIPVVNLVPINNLLNNKCKQNVACCQDSGNNQQSGLVNVGLPCIALSSLI